MANSKISNNNYEYATIDTAPAVGGYWTEEVVMRNNLGGNTIKEMFFSVREAVAGATSVITPILQFKCPGDPDWTDYNNDATDFVVGDRKLIEGNGAGVSWRAGVKQGGWTSGSIILGFDW